MRCSQHVVLLHHFRDSTLGGNVAVHEDPRILRPFVSQVRIVRTNDNGRSGLMQTAEQTQHRRCRQSPYRLDQS